MLKCCSIALGFCGFKAISLEERIEELEESTEEMRDELKNTKKKLKEANMKIFKLKVKTNTNIGWGSTRGWNDEPKVVNSAPKRSSTNDNFEDDCKCTAADDWEVYNKTQKSGDGWNS